MLVLGIESTAHTFSISVVEEKNKRVKPLSNVHDKFPSSQEGYIPRKLAEHHATVFPEVLQKALANAKVKLSDIDAVAYSQGSGIGHSLHVGFIAAYSIAQKLGVPIVPVNHAVAHIEVGRHLNCETTDPLVVYVSGGNTQVLQMDREVNKYKVLGETLDLGLGNFLDNLGRDLHLTPPDAVGVLLEAPKSNNYVELPYSIKGMHLSFTGIQTYIDKNLIPQLQTGKLTKADICMSAQETTFSMLCEATERALCHTDKKEILLCGGNARNKRLQQMLTIMAEPHGVTFKVPEDQYCGDNAAMIALTGALLLAHKTPLPADFKPVQKLRTDLTTINW